MASSVVSASAEIGVPEGRAGLRERRAGPRAHRPPAVVVDRPVAEHLEVLRAVPVLGVGVVERLGEAHALYRRLRDAADRRRGSSPSRSSTVGTMSMMCAYWVRTSPFALMPFGQCTMNGSDEPPR